MARKKDRKIEQKLIAIFGIMTYRWLLNLGRTRNTPIEHNAVTFFPLMIFDELTECTYRMQTGRSSVVFELSFVQEHSCCKRFICRPYVVQAKDCTLILFIKVIKLLRFWIGDIALLPTFLKLITSKFQQTKPFFM